MGDHYKKCSCGKEFYVMDPEQYVYKIRDKNSKLHYFCSYSHYRAKQLEIENEPARKRERAEIQRQLDGNDNARDYWLKEFTAFLAKHSLTYRDVANKLGISRNTLVIYKYEMWTPEWAEKMMNAAREVARCKSS